MSYPARGTTQRGAEAPFTGMRPRSRPRGAHVAVPLTRASGVGSRTEPCSALMRAPFMGITDKAIAAGRLHRNQYVTTSFAEAAA